VVGQVGFDDGSRTSRSPIPPYRRTLQGVAEPDQILISQATRKLVPGLFVTRDLGEVALKASTDDAGVSGRATERACGTAWRRATT